jgi:glycosyltransferase involved in cell wall biosynthesis
MEEGQLSNIRVIIAAYNRKEILLNAIKSVVH